MNTQTARYDPLRRDEYLAACRNCGSNRKGGANGNGSAGAEAGEGGMRVEVGGAGTGAGGVGRTSEPSALPFARLRERTFDMTKRGELTSSNVWYSLRKEGDVGGSTGAGTVPLVLDGVGGQQDESVGGRAMLAGGDVCNGGGGGSLTRDGEGGIRGVVADVEGTEEERQHAAVGCARFPRGSSHNAAASEGEDAGARDVRREAWGS